LQQAKNSLPGDVIFRDPSLSWEKRNPIIRSGLMIFEAYSPCPALRAYVKSYHVRHFTFGHTSAIPFKPYAARPEHTLAFFPRDAEGVDYLAGGLRTQRPRSAVIGQHTLRTNRHLGKDFIVFIVDFYPGVLYRLLGIPLQQLTNTYVDAEVFFSGDIRRVNERLNSTGCYQEMKGIIEQFLVGLVGKIKKAPHAIDQVSNLLAQQPGYASLDALADGCCLGPRQFQRTFTERMGVGPKLFARIARFDKAFRMKNNHPHLDWLTIALACGYHDYQHLVRDYLHFAAATPTAFYQEEGKAPERYFGRHEH
jgi:AraC-like DNA-binding protein